MENQAITPQSSIVLEKNSMLFDLIIPEEVEAKIRHLCNRVHNLEWSGVLFYKVEGIPGEKKFKATCVDLFVMDIGSVGFTQFDYTNEVLSYKIDHCEELLVPGIYEGLIHSHNNMQAFFSGTDEATLKKEGSLNNHFLSLIVNNVGQYVARITKKLVKTIHEIQVITTTTTTSFNTFENLKHDLGTKEDTRTEESNREEITVEYFDANIIKHEVTNPFEELDERLNTLNNRPAPVNRSIQFSLPGITDAKTTPYQPTNPMVSEFEKSESLVGESLSSIPYFPASDQFDEEEEVKLSILEDLYKTEKIPEHILHKLCSKILAGTLLVNKLKQPLDQFMKTIDTRYEQSLGDLTNDLNQDRLDIYISDIIELVIGYPVDETYEKSLLDQVGLSVEDFDYDSTDAFRHLYAKNLIDFLEDKMPKDSIVMEQIMCELQTYLPKIKENASTTTIYHPTNSCIQ